VGVTAAQLVEYLGHSNVLNPTELEDLRGYYSGIKDGFTTWAAVVASKEGATEDKSGAEQLEKLFAELGSTPAVIRRTKAKYLGRDKELVEWLTAEIAKKANDGGKKEAQPDPTMSSTAPVESSSAQAEQTKETAPAAVSSKPTAKPEPVKQQDAPKPAPVEEGW
jgi:hypothetical protein